MNHVQGLLILRIVVAEEWSVIYREAITPEMKCAADTGRWLNGAWWAFNHSAGSIIAAECDATTCECRRFRGRGIVTTWAG
jgi:hypothetical protein